MSATRREYMASAATLAPVLIGWGPLGGSDESDHLEYDNDIPQFPGHITEVRDDESELENYQPKLSVTPEGRSDMRGMYGWIAESEDDDVTAYYYWTRYNTQRSIFAWGGLDWGPDEHFLDHEPTIVFANPDGTVDQVVTTGGHHYAIEIDGQWGNLDEGRVDDRRTHVNLVGVRPWNHYVEAPAGEEGGWVQAYADFGSWLEQKDMWFRNGRYSSTADVAVVDPFTFYDDGSGDARDHWWRKDTWDAWAARHLRLRRLSQTDEFRFEQ